ncbi:MAG: zinc-ribbon domain-containing protein [Desulfohalobiaceae bacterium]|nr:zinc-ribbon domain-containing protein [Desulfohalobiaceae bacterium]
MKIQCPKCGFSREVDAEKIPGRASLATCPKCGQKFYFRDPEPEAEPEEQAVPEERPEPDRQEQDGQEQEDIWSTLESLDSEEQEPAGTGFQKRSRGSFRGTGSRVPWEDLQSHGVVDGFYQTIKQVMLSPMPFFKAMSVDTNFAPPLVFYLIVAEIQVLARFFWGLAGLAPQMDSGTGLPGLGMFGAGSVMVLFLYPVLMALMLFFASGLNHICLTAVKSGTAGFWGTFKVVAYSNAPMLLAVVPLAGPLAGMIWSVVCTFLGFKLVHRTSAGRVVAAMLLPVAILFLISSFMLVIRGVSGG